MNAFELGARDKIAFVRDIIVGSSGIAGAAIASRVTRDPVLIGGAGLAGGIAGRYIAENRFLGTIAGAGAGAALAHRYVSKDPRAALVGGIVGGIFAQHLTKNAADPPKDETTAPTLAERQPSATAAKPATKPSDWMTNFRRLGVPKS